MHISQFANRLLKARKVRGLTQAELARRAEVSTRLVAEVERGERSNVSLATALRLCAEAGITVELKGPAIEASPHRESAPEPSRIARAAVRRATWGGRQIRLAEEGDDDPGASPGRDRLVAVAHVSTQAFAVARARPASKHAVAKPAGSRKR